MSQPSTLQFLGGPLAGQRLEFRGGDVVLGSASGCAVRIDAPGVEAHHARIVIDVTGATIYRLDGAVGVNDDLVTADALLRSGDFVWIGEPGGDSSLMLQFTLGDVEEAPRAPSPEALAVEPPAEVMVEEVVSEDLVLQPQVVEEVLFEEAAPAPALMELPAAPEIVEMEPEPMPEPMSEPMVEAAPLVAENPPEPAPDVAEPPLVEPPPAEPMTLETQQEQVPAPVEPLTEIEPDFEHLLELAPSPPASAPVVPPAPWLTPAAPEPAAEYASAWESAPAAPAAPVAPESGEATILLPPSPPAAPAKPAAPAASPVRPAGSPAPKRTTPSTPKIKIRTVEQDAALRTPPPPPPPARTTSSTPMVVGGLVVLVVLAVVGYIASRPAPVPVPPPPTPTPVVVSTPLPATPEPSPEATQAPVVEPTQEPPPRVATPAAPTPRPVATPLPRATPTPRATPSTRATPTPTPAPARPVTPAPAIAPPVAAPVAPASQAPRLLEEARAAISARDLARASQLLDQVLRLEPGNGEATARKAEVDARLASLGRKFSVSVTTVQGGKAAKKGPSGFDLGGGAVVQTEFSAQIRCTTTPTAIEAGTSYSLRCSIVNVGTKAFRLESIAATETIDGGKSTGAGVTPRQDIASQADAVIIERLGAWGAKSQWSLELVAKTTKDESFRAVYSWR